MICGVLETENVVQINDKTRLSALKSFVSKGNDSIKKVYICPDFDDDPTFIDVSGSSSKDWYLDWIYSGASRTVTAKLKIVTTVEVIADPMHVPPIVGVTEVSETFEKTISILTATDDKLFSSDKDLIAIESDILKWVPDGRASWLNVHRAAQEKILDALNKMGVMDKTGAALTKAAIVDVDEVRFWSRDLTLALIFKQCQTTKDDVFDEKAKYYFGEAAKSLNRAFLRLDTNGDGTADRGEGVSMASVTMVRA